MVAETGEAEIGTVQFQDVFQKQPASSFQMVMKLGMTLKSLA